MTERISLRESLSALRYRKEWNQNWIRRRSLNMHAILLLDCNSITTVRYGPKKWNVNYISVSGISTEERQTWSVLYPESESTNHSTDLTQDLEKVTRMLNTLEDFGYHVLSSCVSQPRDAFKGDENNRECYIWTLHKPREATCTTSDPSVTLKSEASANVIEASDIIVTVEDSDLNSSQESLLQPMKRCSFVLY